MVRDIHEDRFMRKYRYSHLANDSTVPNSPMNIDRHGLANLKKESNKAFDRVSIEPFMVYIFIFALFMAFIMIYTEETD